MSAQIEGIGAQPFPNNNEKVQIAASYPSFWDTLPDLILNLLHGSESRQKFCIEEDGRYLGAMHVTLVSQGSYQPVCNTSGSLNAAFLAQPIFKLVANPAFAPFFGLENRQGCDLIHAIFCRMVKGESSAKILAFDHVQLSYRYHKRHFSLSAKNSNLSEKQREALTQATQFFHTTPVEDFFGKLGSAAL